MTTSTLAYRSAQIASSDIAIQSNITFNCRDVNLFYGKFQALKHINPVSYTHLDVYKRQDVTYGIGAGQMNRVGSADIAIAEAGDKCKGAALASDAFFPFGDTVEAAGKAGITCVIQPGGSIRDQESIDMANKYGITMVFTGHRHFRHC